MNGLNGLVLFRLGFKARLEAKFRPEWINDLDMVAGGDDDIGSPSLGGCGKKVMMGLLRAEAGANIVPFWVSLLS
nr:probable beta-1,4-xylosyltransferase IRX14 [Tanacetum cinerariifolium]